MNNRRQMRHCNDGESFICTVCGYLYHDEDVHLRICRTIGFAPFAECQSLRSNGNKLTYDRNSQRVSLTVLCGMTDTVIPLFFMF